MSTITVTAGPRSIGTRSTASRGTGTASVPVRLTARGKVVVLAMALLAIALLTVAFGPSVVATGEAGAPQDVRSVEVTASTTLWDVAAQANPSGDIRETVDDIVELNSLPSASALTPGTTIAVPVY